MIWIVLWLIALFILILIINKNAINRYNFTAEKVNELIDNVEAKYYASEEKIEELENEIKKQKNKR